MWSKMPWLVSKIDGMRVLLRAFMLMQLWHTVARTSAPCQDAVWKADWASQGTLHACLPQRPGATH